VAHRMEPPWATGVAHRRVQVPLLVLAPVQVVVHVFRSPFSCVCIRLAVLLVQVRRAP